MSEKEIFSQLAAATAVHSQGLNEEGEIKRGEEVKKKDLKGRVNES